jgi:hypothetical protein
MGRNAHCFLLIAGKKKLCLKFASISGFEIILLFSAQGRKPDSEERRSRNSKLRLMNPSSRFQNIRKDQVPTRG